LGKIFETFGPVTNPFYSIRFNNQSEIIEKECIVGSLVFFAPDSTEYSKYVFNVEDLIKTKGSDASWNNDNEPPVECLDYSDDEEEKMAKQKNKSIKKKVIFF
jgi:H/ACA ribonucleoprotein complex non-core subunit NAF1